MCRDSPQVTPLSSTRESLSSISTAAAPGGEADCGISLRDPAPYTPDTSGNHLWIMSALAVFLGVQVPLHSSCGGFWRLVFYLLSASAAPCDGCLCWAFPRFTHPSDPGADSFMACLECCSSLWISRSLDTHTRTQLLYSSGWRDCSYGIFYLGHTHFVCSA